MDLHYPDYEDILEIYWQKVRTRTMHFEKVIDLDRTGCCSPKKRIDIVNKEILRQNELTFAREPKAAKVTIADYFPCGNEIFADGYVIDSEGKKHRKYNPLAYIFLKIIDGDDPEVDGFADSKIRKYFGIQQVEWRYFKDTYYPRWNDAEEQEKYIANRCSAAKKWYRSLYGANEALSFGK